MRIALLGGTFDPIHRGHLMLAREAYRQAGLEKVILLPCYHSPHKPVGPVATTEQRLAMAQLAVEELNEPWLEVSSWEADRETASYSWQTATHFHAEFPSAELFWVLGEDQWQALPKWSRPDRLAVLLHFLVFVRNGATPLPQPDFKASFLQGELTVSSTHIRQQFAAGLGQAACALLPNAVAKFAMENRIYEGLNLKNNVHHKYSNACLH